MRKLVALCGTAVLLIATPAAAAPLPSLEAKVWHTSSCAAADATSGDEFLGGIVLSLLAPLFNTAVKGVGGAIAKAGTPEETRVSGLTVSAFYSGQQAADGTSIDLVRRAQCISLAVDSPQVAPRQKSDISTNNSGAAGAAFLRSQGYTRAPRLYMESRIIVSPDRSAWRLVPVHAFIGETLSTSDRERDLVVTTTFSGPSATADGEALATRSFTFKRAASNYVLPARELERLGTGWMPLPAIGEHVRTRLAAVIQRNADEVALRKLIASGKLKPKELTAANAGIAKLTALKPKDTAFLVELVPVTLKVDVLQTSDGNKALVAIGNFLSENSKTFSEPLASALNAETRREKRLADASAEDEARISAIGAVEAWQTSLTDASKTEASRRVAEIRAEAACRKLQSSGFEDPACVTVSR